MLSGQCVPLLDQCYCNPARGKWQIECFVWPFYSVFFLSTHQTLEIRSQFTVGKSHVWSYQGQKRLRSCSRAKAATLSLSVPSASLPCSVSHTSYSAGLASRRRAHRRMELGRSPSPVLKKSV